MIFGGIVPAAIEDSTDAELEEGAEKASTHTLIEHGAKLNLTA